MAATWVEVTDISIKALGVGGALFLYWRKIYLLRFNANLNVALKHDLDTLSLFEYQTVERVAQPMVYSERIEDIDVTHTFAISSSDPINIMNAAIKLGESLQHFEFNDPNVKLLYEKNVVEVAGRIKDASDEESFNVILEEYHKQRKYFLEFANKYYQNKVKFFEATKLS